MFRSKKCQLWYAISRGGIAIDDKAVRQIKDSIGMIRRAQNLQVESYAGEQITIECTK